MFKFNSNHILTGYIKQLLHSYNLPIYKVYVNSRPNILNCLYIKDGIIQRYLGNAEWRTVKHDYAYDYNILKPNQTKHLDIKNNIYDTYTHEYLGEYLRFQRDYNHLNLMPLYNCFSNNIETTYDLSFTYNYTADESVKVLFDASDSNYKIYSLPVKPFMKYTIAIDCNSKIEMCCGIKTLDNTNAANTLAANTYDTQAGCIFSSQILYSKLINMDWLNEKDDTIAAAIREHIDDLRLFIKLPAGNTSTIVVLEGNYLNWNDKCYTKALNSQSFKSEYNHSIINFDIDTEKEKLTDIKLITPLQLLQGNIHEQYPFSDTLIEYLLNNVININDAITDNIKRVKQIAYENNKNNFVTPDKVLPELDITVDGLWENKLNYIIYDFIQNSQFNKITDESRKFNCLGYADKTVEKYFRSMKGDKAHSTLNSLRDVDIYNNKYAKSKLENGGK